MSHNKDFEEYKRPGLFKIINDTSRTALDLCQSGPEKDKQIHGFKQYDIENQKWQIADIGDQKCLIISNLTGAYARAQGPGKPVVAQIGHPSDQACHWKVDSDPANPKMTLFWSYAHPGAVLEIPDGNQDDWVKVQLTYESKEASGQKWLLKRLS